jgi:hypothetical protein
LAAGLREGRHVAASHGQDCGLSMGGYQVLPQLNGFSPLTFGAFQISGFLKRNREFMAGQSIIGSFLRTD